MKHFFIEAIVFGPTSNIISFFSILSISLFLPILSRLFATTTSVGHVILQLNFLDFSRISIINWQQSFTQIDLPKGVTSGLVEAERLLGSEPKISFNYFSAGDVVRHPLVASIIEAYDKESKRKLNSVKLDN